MATHCHRPQSGWIDFAILSKPGPDGSGRIELFANGKPVVTVRGHVGHADKGLGKNQYFKFGPYRDGHASNWTLYYDDFRRSPDARDEDVLPSALRPGQKSTHGRTYSPKVRSDGDEVTPGNDRRIAPAHSYLASHNMI